MKCPGCNKEQYCPCQACVKRHKEKETWVWKTPNGPIACGHCGHTMSEWDWMNRELEELEK